MRFITGDQNGLIKSIRLNLEELDMNGNGVSSSSLTQDAVNPARSIQQMHLNRETNKLVTARADSSIQQYTLSDSSLTLDEEWSDSRFAQDRYVGLGAVENGILSATHRGNLSFHSQGTQRYLSLPPDLNALRVSPNQAAFACGGLERDLSIWDTARALELSSTTPTAYTEKDLSGANKKERKKAKEELLDGETWRAKNLPPDNLNLRVPIHITALEWLDNSVIATGSANGSVRLYDRRTSRKPVMVSDSLTKSSIRCLRKGVHDNLFVSDSSCGLLNVDTRNLRLLNGYRGIGAAVECVAPTPHRNITLSGAIDKYVRVHTSVLPPEEGKNPTTKANVLAKGFVKSSPTVVEWDGVVPVEEPSKKRVVRDKDSDESDGELDDVLRDMDKVEGEDMKVKRKAEGRRMKKKRV
ncbi:hypothetical protein E3P99_02158 [Wallemia hederae]|uniref:Ribosome biogenesis protein NSA1 n=1 Tax=Wallemia hederae TaxID=1540922 RepID=A0A4T0FN77_9BASI|nr:hypothetical protein E3P99_02158 [Wallemia hederae]